ncbi:hypothetical protein TNCV_2167931 [Trichonephila clavipes]|nr:hypothetical protein TNCV_2167931 [Trichonephila clavipes]
MLKVSTMHIKVGLNEYSRHTSAVCTEVQAISNQVRLCSHYVSKRQFLEITPQKKSNGMRSRDRGVHGTGTPKSDPVNYVQEHRN